MSLVNNNCENNSNGIVVDVDKKILPLEIENKDSSISEYYKFLKQNLVKESTLLSINDECSEKKFISNVKNEYQNKLLNLKMQEMLTLRKLTKIKQVIKNNNYKIYLIDKIKVLSKTFDPFIFNIQISKGYKTNDEMAESDITFVRALRNLQYQLHKLNNLSF
uniref:Uncharacterized protein n=1 Tax=Strongyloides venezuelensis TaxID=75913 RepID=A0A0K0F2T3_STRVS